MVEDTSPFCSACGAAQVRFSVKDPSRALVAVLQTSNAEHITVSAETHDTDADVDNSRVTIRAALYAGLIGAFLSSIPVVANFVVALPVAGLLSVLFYRRWTSGPEVRPSFGFRLGALTGLFGFLAALIVTAVKTLTVSGEDAIERQQLLDVVRLQQARATDPQVRQMFDYFQTPHGMMVMLALTFLMMGIVFVLLSGAGAALAATILRRKGHPQP